MLLGAHRTRVALAAFIALFAVVSVGIYVLRSGPADDPQSLSVLRPQVKGRLVYPYFADLIGGGSGFGLCEFDARVDVEGQTVTAVNRQGRGRSIEIGEQIPESLYVPPRPGVVSLPIGRLGQIHTDVPMYWDEDERLLHRGCAPETVTVVTTPRPAGVPAPSFAPPTPGFLPVPE